MLSDLKRLLRAGKTVVLSSEPDGEPRAFMVDNDDADIYNAMSEADAICNVEYSGTIEEAVKELAAKLPDN